MTGAEEILIGIERRVAKIHNMRTIMDVADLDDNLMVERVVKGDEAAFLALYDRHASYVYALTLRILHDPMLAEEATQDTFLKLWGRARQFLSDRGSLLIWLLTIARRTALDRVRLETRRPMLPNSTDPDDLWPNIPDPGTGSDEDLWPLYYFASDATAGDVTGQNAGTVWFVISPTGEMVK